MSNVSLVIYGVAAFWAVQSLLMLIVNHRRQTLFRLQQAELARREAVGSGVEQAPPPAPGKSPTRNGPQPVKAK